MADAILLKSERILPKRDLINVPLTYPAFVYMVQSMKIGLATRAELQRKIQVSKTLK